MLKKVETKKRHVVEKETPVNYRVPENIPVIPRFRAIVADPPWTKNMTGSGGSYGAAINHYDLMSLERIKALPVSELSAEDAYLFLWVMNSNVDEGLEVMKDWGFRHITMFHWIKPKLGMGNHLRNASETCLVGVRGKIKPRCRTQINWLISYPTIHSEKPREFTSVVERLTEGPYLELFCRRRPASCEKWYCWGNETKGGADIFIPGYPVPKYSFENDNAGKEENNTGAEDSDKEEV